MTKTVLDAVGPEGISNQVMEIARSAALAEMASGIAHEINQPLGAIATFSQAGMRMLDRPEPMVARALDVFRQINSEALNAGEGIRRIRRLFDQEDIVRSRCRMDELIDELQPVLELLAKKWNGRLACAPAKDSPWLSVDRAKIQHVLFSLVLNGFEAAAGAASPPLVRIISSSDRYGLETSIVDSGAGVPAGSQPRLFRPFYTTKSGGTGLGLASSHSIVEAHQGSMGFENLPGGGCRFWFRLPAAEDQ